MRLNITVEVSVEVEDAALPGLLALAERRGYGERPAKSGATLLRRLINRTMLAAVENILDGRYCRVCGCSDDDACEDGCEWVEEDLCSQCVGDP